MNTDKILKKLKPVVTTNVNLTVNGGVVAVVGIVTAGIVGCFLGSRKTSIEKYRFKKAADERVNEIKSDITRREIELQAKEIAREFD